MSKTVNPKTGKFCSFHLVGTVLFQSDMYGIIDTKEKYVWYAGDDLPESITVRNNSRDFKEGYVHIPEKSINVKDEYKNINGKITVKMEDFKDEVKLVKKCSIDEDLSYSEIVEHIRSYEPNFNIS